MFRIIPYVLTCLLAIAPLGASFAQEPEAAGENAAEAGVLGETKNDLMVVIGAGAAGAILGLSTLSFVDRPSEHLRNIVMGGAIGVIFGVVYVGYLQATKSSDNPMNEYGSLQDETFWAKYDQQDPQKPLIAGTPLNVQYSLKF